MAPMKKRAEKEGGKKKKMIITTEVKNESVSRPTARGYGDLVWGGEKGGDIPLFK
jgi:hypothetical protein